jgi:hypothetical protein
MFRKITNRFAGRKKVTDESMDFSAVQELLAGLNGATRINVDYNSGGDCTTFRDATPTDIAQFVRKEFKPYFKNFYMEANHQVFSGEQNERHFVDLRYGMIQTSVGKREFRQSPYVKATLDYVLETKK